jgi:L-iditol 2-dehydrogenase
VIEAIGHHASPLEAAVHALKDYGTLLAFGVPDDTHYAFPFRAFFRKHATLIAGAATDRARALEDAYAYLKQHKDLLAPYLTHTFPVTQAQQAFERAAHPSRDRLKVALVVPDDQPEPAR